MGIHINLDEIEAASAEPSVTFTLDGRDWACKPRGEIPAFVVDGILGGAPMRLDVIYRSILIDKVERDGKSVNQVEEFMQLLTRPDSPFGIERMQKLAEKLVEAVLNRPTARSTPSRRGPRTTGATSKAGSSSRGARAGRRAS